jgi:hypothetical protein
VIKAARAVRTEIKRIDCAIAKAVKQDGRLTGLVGELAGIDGVGVLTASKIVALVPELGTLGRRDSAALAGLAPFKRDSGKFKGKSFINAASVRGQALIMPATVAINKPVRGRNTRNCVKQQPYKCTDADMRKLSPHMTAGRKKARRTWMTPAAGSVARCIDAPPLSPFSFLPSTPFLYAQITPPLKSFSRQLTPAACTMQSR